MSEDIDPVDQTINDLVSLKEKVRRSMMRLVEEVDMNIMHAKHRHGKPLLNHEKELLRAGGMLEEENVEKKDKEVHKTTFGGH